MEATKRASAKRIPVTVRVGGEGEGARGRMGNGGR